VVKYCGKCGETRPVSEFHRWYKGDGYQPWCKACRKVYDAAYHQRNRERRRRQKARWHAQFIAWYRSLKEGPCTDCGRTFVPAAMHWDHLPGTAKVNNLGDLGRRWSRKAVLDELKKCELVCANCHAIRTVRRRSGA
jgi:hypothetical protein